MSVSRGAVLLGPGTSNIGSVGLLSSAGVALGVRPDAELRVAMDPSNLLFDTFETIDTTNTWTLGGTINPTGANGLLTISAGTAASGSSFARSQYAFTPASNAYLDFSALLTLDAAAVTGNKRIFGFGVPATTPSVSVPITNGAVFEVQDTDGSLIGAVYSNSARTQTVALTRPTDGTVHRYAIYYKASRVYFEIDNVTVGSIAFPNPQVSALPLVAMSVNAAAGMPATAATLTSTLMGLADTGRNNTQISDAAYPWRKATVSSGGSLATTSRMQDGAANLLTSTAVGTARPLDVNLAGSAGAIAQVGGTITAAVGNTPGTAVTASTTAQIVANVAQSGNVTFHLVASAFVGTLIFEASVDAGLNYGPVFSVREDGSGSETGAALNLAAAFIRQYSAALPGLTYFRVRCSAFTSGSLAVVLAPGPFLAEPSPSLGASSAVIGQVALADSPKATYVAVSSPLSSNIASDIWTLAGSATKTVKVSRVEVSVQGGGTITAAQAALTLLLRTAANTGGTTAAATITRLDQSDPVNTATALGYTAAPTALGTGVGIRRQPYVQAAAGTATAPPLWVWDFGNRPEKMPTLRGTSQLLALNNSVVAAGTTPTLTWSIVVEFTEE